MAIPTMDLLWRELLRHRGAHCVLNGATVQPRNDVVFLPLARQGFLDAWSGSKNPRTRAATYGRVLQSLLRSGRVYRINLAVPLVSGSGDGILRAESGRLYGIPRETPSPFVCLQLPEHRAEEATSSHPPAECST